MDEATIRVIVQDASGGQAAPSGAGPAPAPSGGPGAPPPPSASPAPAASFRSLWQALTPMPPITPQDIAQQQHQREEWNRAVKEAYDKLYPQAPQSMISRVLGLGQNFRGLLGGVFGPAAGATLDIGSMVGGAGAAAAALNPLTIAAGATAVGLFALDRAIHPLVDRFAGYSGPISAAQANAELRRELNDIRRAQDTGPRFAEYLTAQSKMSEAWEDIKLALVNALLPIATSILEILTALMPLIQAGLLPLTVAGDIIQLIRDDIKKGLRYLKILSDEEVANAFEFHPLRDILIPGV